MIEIKDKKDCCGCYGCENICPKNCISMNNDNEGFWYPKVNNLKCIDCGLCEKVCPMKHSKNNSRDSKFLAIKNKDEIVRVQSSSGGIFSILSEFIINNNGHVFGVGFDKEFNVIHKEAKTLSEIEGFRGSKYVQSKVGRTYREVKKLLCTGKLVLFSGTQCQIKGLNLFLNKAYENLVTVEIICHGVPSPKVYSQFLDIQKLKYNDEIKSINFRDKSNGWKLFSHSIKFNNDNRYIKNLTEDVFMKGFLRNLYLRPSCNNCKSKNFVSGADLSLADYWGVQNIHPEFDDDKGVSLVLVNSDKGQTFIDKISDKIDMIETDGEFAIKNNHCIVKPVNYNPKREKFFEDFDKMDLIKNIEDKTKANLGLRCKFFIRRLLWRK